MRKRERQVHVSHLARELARSGKFSNWRSIETELRFRRGFPVARSWLDDQLTRKELDDFCQYARGVRNDA